MAAPADWATQLAATAAANAMTGGGAATAFTPQINEVKDGVNKYKSMLHKYISVESLRDYFEVSNKYVRDKLILVLAAPAAHFGSERFKFPEPYQRTGDRQQPKYDLHVPDLYIPTMALLTYTILSAFALGTYGEFNPDVLFTTGDPPARITATNPRLVHVAWAVRIAADIMEGGNAQAPPASAFSSSRLCSSKSAWSSSTAPPCRHLTSWPLR